MSWRRSLFVDLVALILLAALVLFLRLPALPLSVIDWDESVYLLMARGMLQGHAPYTLLWDHKPPGLYLLFALAQLVFGQTILAMRLLAVIMVTATSFLLWLYGRAVLGSRVSGALAALFYALFSLSNGGLASNAEIMWAPFTAAAFLLLRTRTDAPLAIRPGRPFTFLAIGLLLGVAVQIKTLAGMELLALLGLIALAPLLSRRLGQPASAGPALLAAALVMLGALAPTLLAVGAFARAGHLADYVSANVTANLIYARGAPPLALAAVWQAWWAQARGAPLLWLSALAALPLAWMARRRQPRVAVEFAVLGLWLLGALAAILLTGRLFPHYFLQALPPLSLLAAAAIVQAARLESSLPRRWQTLLIGFLVVIGLTRPLVRSARQSVAELQALTRGTPRVELLAGVAHYLRERMAPEDYLYVADGQPILYYLTDAAIPTRYILPVWLNNDLAPMAGIDPPTELERIMALQPRYVVLTEESLRDPPFMAHLQRYLTADYTLERTIQGIMLYRLKS